MKNTDAISYAILTLLHALRQAIKHGEKTEEIEQAIKQLKDLKLG